MSQYLFSVVLFLLLVCCTCGLAYTDELKGVNVPVPGKTKLPSQDQSNHSSVKTFKFFKSPCLFVLNGVMALLAEAYHTQDKRSNRDIVGMYMGSDWKDWPTMFTEEEVGKWESEIIVTNFIGKSGEFFVEKPTVAVKSDEIFLYFSSVTRQNRDDGTPLVSYEWDYWLIFGKAESPAKGKTKINWKKPVSLKASFEKYIGNDRTLRVIGSGGSGIVTKNQTIVIPVTYDDENLYPVSTIIYSIDNGINWVLVPSTLPPGCNDPILVEWEEGKLIVITACSDGLREVYESTDMGKTWTEAVTTLSCVWANSKQRDEPGIRGAFITAEIDNKKLMLFTQPVETDQGKYQFHLWITDKARIYDVGPITTDCDKDSAIVLLYTDGKLFSLYNKGGWASGTLHFSHLTHELERIRFVLNHWAETDKYLSTLCSSDKTKTDLSDRKCVAAPMPTVGLVGFLSNKTTGDTWQDEYLCVHAIVRGARKVPNGFQFKGHGAGAQWPVSKQGQTQRYLFANYVFTLVATVTIHEIPKGDSPLLGASGSNKLNLLLMSVLFNNKQQWILTSRGMSFLSKKTWEVNRTYNVALVMRHGAGSLFVDGEPMSHTGQGILRNVLVDYISHFFVGGYGSDEGNGDAHMTVTNILLYNRPLNTTELDPLRRMKALATEPTSSGDNCVCTPLAARLLFLLVLGGLAALF